ncbi:hypothetical protein DCE93_02890 [Agromyces badenianii]|uniref:Uncharacterized protein n=1 Tax=Agromyces badenianii TaxID=2080742 RepID=A0A2S0WTU4_9MICO|nr:hypothetical protein [Agromyces badenianii]AWB94732.1 hypothetical protein DCE93_02890 [Agromyces badenianii]
MRPDYARYEEEIIRLFYDYTTTVLWFPYPVAYEESGLSPALIAGLRAWGQLFEDGLDSDFQWRSPELPARVDRERRELAHRLGDELGSAFEVEFDVGFGPRTASYRSTEPPTNPAAAAVFAAWAEAARAERADLERRAAEHRESGETGGWYAVIPGTEQRFVPLDTPPPE